MLAGPFELFRVGLGPSASHTMGPMRAAGAFAATLGASAAPVAVELRGSLALTGRGHGTHAAVLAGLAGIEPERATPQDLRDALSDNERTRRVTITEARRIPAGHPNEMRFTAGEVEETWWSVGGGAVRRAGADEPYAREVSLPFCTAAELLAFGRPLSEVVRANEEAHATREEVDARLDEVLDAMDACIELGLRGEGVLPGGLGVERRAAGLHAQLQRAAAADDPGSDPLEGLGWLNLWALAVNEQNASGERVVTAPTNGAAGVLPAVLRYHRDRGGCDRDGQRRMLLTAAAIGSLVKQNASISGAEMGCQGEVGTAAAMAAAALAEALGGTPEQAEHAAEIALEHHLGMTCDPVGGLVQVPCIERNAIGAVKAVTAARLAVTDPSTPLVSLDQAIETLRQTGRDMRREYKETSLGGLAVNVVAC